VLRGSSGSVYGFSDAQPCCVSSIIASSCRQAGTFGRSSIEVTRDGHAGARRARVRGCVLADARCYGRRARLQGCEAVQEDDAQCEGRQAPGFEHGQVLAKVGGGEAQQRHVTAQEGVQWSP